MTKIKLYFFLFIFAFLFLSGCQTKTDTSPKQTLRINLQGEPASLNPHSGVDLYCRIIQKALFECLTRVHPDGDIHPAGAQSIEISEDQKTYTFHLRPMYWSNGKKVTAHDYADTWKKALSPHSNCLRADLFYIIQGASAAKKNTLPLGDVGIEVPNEQTMVVHLQHPAPYFLELISNSIFAPQPFGKEQNTKNTISNGPFLLKSWEPGKLMTLVKNPQYWDSSSVILDEILISFIQDSHTALCLFEKGELDWVGTPLIRLPLEALPSLRKSNQLHTMPIASAYWLSCNTQIYPLQSEKIRKSLAYCIDREEITSHILLEEFATTRLIPSCMSHHCPPKENFKADIQKAQTLFEEGVQELQIQKEDFPAICLSYSSDVPGQKSLVEFLQKTWEKHLGIKVKIEGKEWNVFFSDLNNKQYQLAGCNWSAAFNDPIYFLDFFKDPSSRYNVPQWENIQFQNLLAKIEQETQNSLRKEYIREAEDLLLNESPIIPLYSEKLKFICQDKVKKLLISELGYLDFKWTFLQ